MGKRTFDLIVSVVALILLSPFFLLIALAILMDSKGGIFFRQVRVGRNNKDFRMFKFRTMIVDADKKGLLLTIGARDPRVTSVGHFLRKYKIDELPQLLNVLAGTMSLVGPRPEVRRYVDMYNSEQLKVLSVKPGITDYSSIEYIDESKLMDDVSDPEKIYIEEIMPAKLALNLRYIREQSFFNDLRIVVKTIIRVIF